MAVLTSDVNTQHECKSILPRPGALRLRLTSDVQRLTCNVWRLILYNRSDNHSLNNVHKPLSWHRSKRNNSRRYAICRPFGQVFKTIRCCHCSRGCP